MNYEKLNSISKQPETISATDAQELEELTRSFPYFSLPFILLSRYYSQHNDYRLEDVVQKTALRISDRDWLFRFLHALPLVQESQKATDTILLTEEPNLKQTSTEYKTVEDTLIEEPTVIAKAESLDFNKTTLENFTDSQRLFEIDLEPISEQLNLGAAEIDENVYEEISSFETADTNQVDISAEVNVNEHAQDDAWIDSIGNSTMLTPLSELEAQTTLASANIELSSAVEAKTEIHVTELDADAVYEEISEDFVSQPEIPQPIFKIEQANPENLSPPEIVPKTNQHYYAKSAYNIEDYFTSKKEKIDPSDFFSWLSNPHFHEKKTEIEPITEEKEPDEDLITRFIRTNPSITRPKSEFFHPADVAKKSEAFPDDLATETLANVYIQQNNPAHAIKIYEKLGLKFPTKSTYFAALIEKTKKEHNL